jgi:hypothetical protein
VTSVTILGVTISACQGIDGAAAGYQRFLIGGRPRRPRPIVTALTTNMADANF